MKRLITLLLLTTVAALYASGRFYVLLEDVFVRQSTADAVTLVDTVIVSNASSTLLLYPTAQLNPSTQYGKIQFASATTTAALRDTARFFTRIATGPVSDTIALNVALGANSANGDSVFVSFYADAGVQTDTVYTTARDFPPYAQNIFESHLDAISNEESTGVVVNIQNRTGDWGDWNTIATHTLDLSGEEQRTALNDTTSAGIPIGDYLRAMIITYDSTRGTRGTASKVQVIYRGRE